MTEAVVELLPRSPRARRVYWKFRNLGFVPKFALDVANALENASSELARWVIVQRVLQEDPEGAREWLQAQGYT